MTLLHTLLPRHAELEPILMRHASPPFTLRHLFSAGVFSRALVICLALFCALRAYAAAYAP